MPTELCFYVTGIHCQSHGKLLKCQRSYSTQDGTLLNATQLTILCIYSGVVHLKELSL